MNFLFLYSTIIFPSHQQNYEIQVISTQIKVKGGQAPFLKLTSTIMPAVDFCFPRNISTHFPCGGESNFLTSSEFRQHCRHMQVLIEAHPYPKEYDCKLGIGKHQQIKQTPDRTDGCLS